jgi:hypothetical protein
MNIAMVTITAGGLTTLIIEGIKYIYRKVVKKPDYDFPGYFYIIAIPAMNLAVIPLLALMGVEGFIMPTNWVLFGNTILLTVVASLISLSGYTVGLKPLQSYRNMMIRREERDELQADAEEVKDFLNSDLVKDMVLEVLNDQLKTVESLEEGESVDESLTELG